MNDSAGIFAEGYHKAWHRRVAGTGNAFALKSQGVPAGRRRYDRCARQPD